MTLIDLPYTYVLFSVLTRRLQCSCLLPRASGRPHVSGAEPSSEDLGSILKARSPETTSSPSDDYTRLVLVIAQYPVTLSLHRFKPTSSYQLSISYSLSVMDGSLPTPNIVLFGESGSGKSSIVNMIGDRGTAPVGSGAQGVTFRSDCYPVTFDGREFNVYDTAGLDEADKGSVPKREATVQLYKLLKSLQTGVNLLIFCMRAPRIKDTTYKNWRLFYEIICGGHVPIILAITGLEQEDDMDQWWFRSKGAFQKYEMHPNGIACITATRGKQLRSGNYLLDAEYEESQAKMRTQIRTHCLEQAWRVPPVEWFKKIVEVAYETRWCSSTIEHQTTREEAAEDLEKIRARCKLSKEEAWELGKALSQD